MIFGQLVRDGQAPAWRPAPGSGLAAEGRGTVLTDGSLVVAADARIDDRERLSRELDLDPNAAAPQLIAAAWRRWGVECPAHLLGDYAFAIWDETAGQLFCARDHIGARPFYYALEGRFSFAGSIEALLALPGVPDAIDEDAVATRLTRWDFFPLERTFLRAVRKLPPAHRLTLDGQGARIDRYWFPERLKPVRLPRDEDYAETLRGLMDEAVQDRLQGEGRIGVHVSGGLDCSSIAVLATRALRRAERPDPVAFSWTPEPQGAPEGEQAWAESARAVLGLEFVAPVPTADDLVRLFRMDLTRWVDVGNLFHEDAVQQHAVARGVRIMLSGWGGDEAASFNGRGFANELFWTGRWRALARHGREAGVPLRSLVRRALQAAVSELLPKPESFHLANPEFVRRRRLSSSPISMRSVRATQLSLLRHGHITARIEEWAVSGAARGIEYRYPMLDRRVLEFAYAIPTHLFRRGRHNRWLMRKAVEPLLPADVVWNPLKTEPVRVAALREPMEQAWAQIAAQLEARREPPARAGWIDMPALRQALSAVRWDDNFKPAPVRMALQFLDL